MLAVFHVADSGCFTPASTLRARHPCQNLECMLTSSSAVWDCSWVSVAYLEASIVKLGRLVKHCIVPETERQYLRAARVQAGIPHPTRANDPAYFCMLPVVCMIFN